MLENDYFSLIIFANFNMKFQNPNGAGRQHLIKTGELLYYSKTLPHIADALIEKSAVLFP